MRQAMINLKTLVVYKGLFLSFPLIVIGLSPACGKHSAGECLIDADCGSSGKTCKNEKCIGTECVSNNDCGEHRVCDQGQCRYQSGGICASASDCHDPSETCFSGMCVPASQVSRECTSVDQCLAGEYCVAGSCSQHPAPCTRNNLGESICGSSPSCEGDLCHIQQSTSCDVNGYCASGRCQYDTSHLEKTKCTGDGTCHAGLCVLSNRCTVTADGMAMCNLDGCEGMTCKLRDPTNSCSVTGYCKQGDCVFDYNGTEGMACSPSTANPCIDLKTCKSGECVPYPMRSQEICDGPTCKSCPSDSQSWCDSSLKNLCVGKLGTPCDDHLACTHNDLSDGRGGCHGTKDDDYCRQVDPVPVQAHPDDRGMNGVDLYHRYRLAKCDYYTNIIYAEDRKDKASGCLYRERRVDVLSAFQTCTFMKRPRTGIGLSFSANGSNGPWYPCTSQDRQYCMGPLACCRYLNAWTDVLVFEAQLHGSMTLLEYLNANTVRISTNTGLYCGVCSLNDPGPQNWDFVLTMTARYSKDDFENSWMEVPNSFRKYPSDANWEPTGYRCDHKITMGDQANVIISR